MGPLWGPLIYFIMYKCAKPLFINLQTVPCGTCYECQMRKRAEWDLRLRVENRTCESFFVTLTMDDDHYVSPNKRALQLFFKTLRNQGLVFKYYAVAEFGERTGRGHYHLCLFVKKWSESIRNMHDIVRFWDKGMTDIAPLNDASIHYVTKWHVHPKYSKNNTKEQHGFHPAVKRPWLFSNIPDLKGKFYSLREICWGYSPNCPIFSPKIEYKCSRRNPNENSL